MTSLDRLPYSPDMDGHGNGHANGHGNGHGNSLPAPGVPLLRQVLRPPGYTPRRGTGLPCYERVLVRAGLGPVAGIDEAGRGACAGPLVVAAVVLPPSGSPIAQLADSKALTPAVREEVYREVVARALAWHTVVIPPGEIDRRGLHVCNVAGMRRALAGMSCRPGYVLTDGFAVSGLTVPALAMWKGDQVAACVANAGSVRPLTAKPSVRTYPGRHDMPARALRMPATLHTCRPRRSISPGGITTVCQASARATTSR